LEALLFAEAASMAFIHLVILFGVLSVLIDASAVLQRLLAILVRLGFKEVLFVQLVELALCRPTPLTLLAWPVRLAAVLAPLILPANLV